MSQNKMKLKKSILIQSVGNIEMHIVLRGLNSKFMPHFINDDRFAFFFIYTYLYFALGAWMKHAKLKLIYDKIT